MSEKAGGVKQALARKPSLCHPERPLYALGMCRSCYEIDLRKRNPEYAERQRENCRAWGETHQEQKKRVNAAYQAKRDPAMKWAWSLMRTHGITPDDYEGMLQAQGGVCAICGKEPNGRRLAVDHCHKTGRVRGLLCFRCNFGLSWFQEEQERLQSAADYLRCEDDE